jgi:cytosine/adenosine deaminase-related metal-dependent hydrolase
MTEIYSADWVVPVDGDPIENGAVAVENGRIAAVGPADELGEGNRFDDAAILPGFVNAHSHLEYAVYGGFGDGLAFGPWIRLHIERKQRIAWDDYLCIARLGAAECLRSGMTTIADSSFSGAAAFAAAELGLRGIVGREVFGADPTQLDEIAADPVPETAGTNVVLGFAPHAPYSVSADLYRAVYAENPAGRCVITHVAESDDELEYLLHGTGPIAEITEVEPPGTTPVRYMAAEGLLKAVLVAAHCVKVDEEEIELLREHDVAVAHCPRSNALLGCGVAPLRELLDAGLRVGLGTDSPASTPSFDMFEEMRTAVYMARARAQRPDGLPATEALRLATLGSASALGLDDEIGSLAPGKRADLAVVSLAGSPYLPWEDPAAAVVFGGSPDRVLLTVVAGEERYEKGGFAWLELRRSAAAARACMLSAEPLAHPKT